ncbi:MAG: hypothetical protein BWK73_41695 [Thiothrix lacustris]|uniref:Fido domain-containing protein n=1 Tax=Thiothrix lacustris TaxID=525917 RepID=A0A1Y1QD99_9GAMM|nr:MAG: hypothetical protein BWK73_41695 [Thiothrix lacustris]
MSEIIIYQTADQQTQVEVKLDSNTLWLSQKQIADVFGTEVPAINKHIKNIIKEGELDPSSTISKMEMVQTEGKRSIKRHIETYNLDMIISVGYRVNSARATQFRIWATQRLRDYLVQGYAIDQQRLRQNADELEQALKLFQKTAQSTALNLDAGRGLVHIISRYTQTFLWLQLYDEGLLNEPSGQTGGCLPSVDEAQTALAELKRQLIARGEATDLFAHPRGDSLASLLGNLEQSVFGEPAYPTIESKAAHLLYFVVKNHPFSDGNKRSGAFLFVDFLYRNGRLFNQANEPIINDVGLAALTLLVAESAPTQKDTLIRLIMNLLAHA